jgi:adenylate cyclase
MAFAEDLKKAVEDLLLVGWNVRRGNKAPTVDSVALRDGAVRINATFAYADLAKSSDLAQDVTDEIAARVIRAYVSAATRVFRKHGGEIRSFDGDRVMAVFMGESHITRAVDAGLGINWAVHKVIRPQLDEHWPANLDPWVMNHAVGIDTGEALMVRGGVRDSNDQENNDLIAVGPAPNVAAKLSGLRHRPSIYITQAVWEDMASTVSFAQSGDREGEYMWDWSGTETIGGKTVDIHGSTWWRGQ